MKKLKLLLMAVGLLLIPMVYQVQSTQNQVNPPPVEPVLVRQGDFARSLVEILDLGTAYSEAQAQEMLDDLGIEPKDGWISDHPMTPGIIGELQDAVVKASDYGYLALNRSEALDLFQTLVADYGLPIIPDDNHANYSESPPSVGSYGYTEPTVINNYYYRTGPPVVTYYPPPSRYYHLYNWFPYPFRWGSFRFSGYFVMNDFHRTSPVIILNRYGHKKHFRKHKRVPGVVSNRTKRYHHTRKGVAVYPFPRQFEKKHNSPFFKHDIEKKRGFGNNAFIRGDNRSNKRFRNDTKHQINNRFYTIPDKRNHRMEKGVTNPRNRIGNNPREFGKPNNNRGSINKFHNPAPRDVVRENGAPVIRENRSRFVPENQKSFIRENRKGLDRFRPFEGNRSFQGRDRTSFQRID